MRVGLTGCCEFEFFNCLLGPGLIGVQDEFILVNPDESFSLGFAKTVPVGPDGGNSKDFRKALPLTN